MAVKSLCSLAAASDARNGKRPDGRRGDKDWENGLHGKNGFGKAAYGGPCPPNGTHRYYFRLYALDAQLTLQSGAARSELGFGNARAHSRGGGVNGSVRTEMTAMAARVQPSDLVSM